MSGALRVGVVGCGVAMMNPYMSTLQKLKLRGAAEVVAACDTADSKRAVVREKFGITDFTTDYRELTERDDIDLIMVLTSMPAHGPITRAALQAGKHVLVEKPMSTDLDEAFEIVELAKTSRGYLICAPFVMLSPTYQAMAIRLQRGEIGQVHTARARYGWHGPWWGPWFYRKGGGALFDLSVYNITSLTGFLGPAKRVTAMMGIATPERVVDGELVKVEADDNAQILIDFGNTTFAVVTCGFTIKRMRSPAIELYADEGTMQMQGEDWAPNGFEVYQLSEGAWKIYEETEPNWHWTFGIEHFVDCIHRGIRPLLQPEHALNALEVIIKAMESSADGRTKDIKSTFTPTRFAELGEHEPAYLNHDPRTRAK
jgi:predicted dehydrogenase